MSCNISISNKENDTTTVIHATTSKQENANFLSFLGVIPLIDNKHPSQWLPTIQNTIDICFDISCTDTNYYESSRKSLSREGVLVCISSMNSVYSASYLDNDVYCDCFGGSNSTALAEMKARYFMKNTFFYDILDICNGDRSNKL